MIAKEERQGKEFSGSYPLKEAPTIHFWSIFDTWKWNVGSTPLIHKTDILISYESSKFLHVNK